MTVQSAKIKARIRKLREMTQQRGCSEAEALAFAEKAAALVREAGLSETEVYSEECGSRSRVAGRADRGLVWAQIALCTNTAVMVRTSRGNGSIVSYVGYGGGPEVADYLRVVCDRAIDKAIREFKTTVFYRHRRNLKTKRAAVADFTRSFCSRIIVKLQELFASSMDREAFQSALALRDELYPKAQQVPRLKRPTRFFNAGLAGLAAGARVNLSHGVRGTKTQTLIGSEQ